jgi:hypothetical protein
LAVFQSNLAIPNYADLKKLLPAFLLILIVLVNLLGYDAMHFMWHCKHGPQTMHNPSFSSRSFVKIGIPGRQSLFPSNEDPVVPDHKAGFSRQDDDRLISKSLSFVMEKFPPHAYPLNPCLFPRFTGFLKESPVGLFLSGFCISIFQPPKL